MPYCDFETCEQALRDYLDGRALNGQCMKPLAPPDLVCWEHQANREPIRLSFAIKVF